MSSFTDQFKTLVKGWKVLDVKDSGSGLEIFLEKDEKQKKFILGFDRQGPYLHGEALILSKENQKEILCSFEEFIFEAQNHDCKDFLDSCLHPIVGQGELTPILGLICKSCDKVWWVNFSTINESKHPFAEEFNNPKKWEALSKYLSFEEERQSSLSEEEREYFSKLEF